MNNKARELDQVFTLIINDIAAGLPEPTEAEWTEFLETSDDNVVGPFEFVCLLCRGVNKMEKQPDWTWTEAELAEFLDETSGGDGVAGGD